MKISQHKYTGAWNELLFASVPVFLFVLGGFVTYCGRGETPTPKDLLGLAVVCAAFLANVCAAVAEQRSGCAARPDGRKRDWRPLLLLLAVAFLLRLPQVGSMPRNDAAGYYEVLYDTCRNFDLSLSYYLDHFSMAAHPSYGVFSLAAIPEFFFPGNRFNRGLFQTAISLGAIFCIYDFLERELDTKRAFWGALVVGCTPMFLGLVNYFQLDFSPPVFFFYVMWAFYRRKYVLLAWFSLLLVWSKEFGVVLLVGFFLGVFFYSFAAAYTGGFRQRVYAALHDARLVWLCFLCLLNGVSILYSLSRKSWIAVPPDENGVARTNIWGHLGWDLGYTVFKLIEWFSLNFTWLTLIPVLWLAVRALRAHAGKKAAAPHIPAELRLLVAGSVGGGVLYYIFSCFVITVTSPRYDMAMEMLAFFWGISAVVSLDWSNKRLFRPAAAAFCALLAIQAYWTVDPVMLALYPRIETGGIPMVNLNAEEVPWYGRGDWWAPPGWQGDYTIYNAQYRYLDKCMCEMLVAENYDENTDIVQVGVRRGVMYSTGEYNYYWDPESKRFTFVEGDDMRPVKVLIMAADDNEVQECYDKGTLHERAIIVLPPSMDGQAAVQKEFEETLPAFYTNVERHEIRCLPAGVLPYYTAELVTPGP